MALHVKDYEIRWKNFRGFVDTGWIKIRPLTILIGANNSGKTSVFAPLLLMSQTARSPDAQTPLVTRGPLFDAGSPLNLFHEVKQSTPLYFGFKYHLHNPPKNMKAPGEYPPGLLEIMFTADKDKELLLQRFDLSDIYGQHILTKTIRADGTYQLDSKLIGKLKKDEKDSIEQTQPMNFHFSAGNTIQILRQKNENANPSFSNAFSKYLSCVGFEHATVTSILLNLTYVGPMRKRLERYYEASGETPESVGVSGEEMANIIRRADDRIRAKLDQWIARFEFGKKLEVLQAGADAIFSLMFNTGGRGSKRRNVAESGFGVSQVLPLIVQALTANEDTLTIAEQPEIHLNPRLQCTLADLFVEMANTDHRVIVETHSEHLLLRLRTLIATEAIDREKVAIYFVERQGEESIVREIDISDDGSIDANKWPKGFFGETLAQSLALAEAQSQFTKKRTAERKKND